MSFTYRIPCRVRLICAVFPIAMRGNEHVQQSGCVQERDPISFPIPMRGNEQELMPHTHQPAACFRSP